MIKTLQKHGNSQALVIDKGLMDALGIDMDTPLAVTVKGNQLVIEPADVGLGEARVKELMSRLRPRYGQMLKNLAE
jgi:antitoxin component of MazEF toxin-antitoxin module